MSNSKKNKAELLAELGTLTARVVELERRELEMLRTIEALSMSEVKYRAVFEQAADAIVLIDVDSGAILEFNQKAHEHLGYTREEFQNINMSDIEAMESKEEFWAHVRKVKEIGTAIFETKHKTKSGEIRDILVNCRFISVGDKKFFQSILSDITERKQLKMNLGQSEKKYRSLVDILSDCVYEIDKDFKYAYVSPRMEDISGYGPEHYVGKTPFDFMAPGEAQRLSDIIQDGLKSPQPFRGVENVTVRKNGRIGVVETSAMPIYDSMGEHSGYICVDRDITKRRRAEETLRESEEKWRSLVENAPDIILTVDNEGRILFINHTSAGVNAEDALGRNALDSVAPEYRERVIETIQRVFQTGESDSYEVVARGPNDMPSWYATSVGAMRLSGKVVSVILIARDITDRKAMEFQIRQREAHLQSILETSLDGIAVTSEQQRVVYGNTSLAHMFGYDKSSDVIDTETINYIAPESYPILKMFRERLDKREPIDNVLEFRGKRKDGSTFDAELKVGFFFEEGQRLDVAAIRDVTERKKMESQFRQSSKLAAIGELAAGVAHEINNPIATIDVHTGLMRDIVEEESENLREDFLTKLQSHFGTVEGQVRRCRSMTNNLLSFTRIPKQCEDAVDLNILLRQALDLVVGLTDKNPKVELVLDERLPLLQCDQHQLQQVFINILTNALKAIDSSGAIAITSCLNDDGRISIIFKDSGCGIPEEMQERIFDPFFTTRREGTGLGLAISHYTIQQMNGNISVESSPGQGTAFTITLPVSSKMINGVRRNS